MRESAFESGPLLPDPRDRPTIGFGLVCRALDISTSKGYELVAKGTFPIPLRKLGGVWKAKTIDVHRYVGTDLADVS